MDTKFTEVNDVACEILGYSRNELLTMSPLEIAAPEEHVNLPTIMKRILTEKHVIFNVALRSKAGQSIPVELSAHLFDFKGQPTLLSVARDITERRKGEEALQQSKARLQCLSSQLMNAQEQERALIARELHDSIGQTLSAIKFRLETALFQAEDQNVSSGLKSLEDIVPIVQHAIEEIRRICTDLRPSMLDDLGIVATIHWFCRQFQATYPQIKIEKHLDIREEEISEQQKTVVFRVMQEALHNVAKHSEADLVRLSFEKTNQEIRLTINDNGIGFDLQPTLARRGVFGGMGLASMKERTELADGAFTIESILNEGTTVRASWPCAPGS
jgi:PAS domain S-box-containing protein